MANKEEIFDFNETMKSLQTEIKIYDFMANFKKTLKEFNELNDKLQQELIIEFMIIK